MVRTLAAIVLPLLSYLFFLLSARLLGRKVVIFHLPMIGELPYILPLMQRLSRTRGYAVGLACSEYPETIASLKVHLGQVTSRSVHLTDARFVDLFGSLAHLYVTAEQFHPTPSQMYSICIFHGQPSKGITFSRTVLPYFDSFFFIGPLHRHALERFLRHNRDVGYLPEIFEAGYPKTDALFNDTYDRKTVLADLRMDPALPTVLYAPAFNEYATLRTIGEELVETITAIEGVNLIIKLAPDSIRTKDNVYATGGISWNDRLARFNSERCRIAGDLDINLFLVAADIMVTDVSGVAWDFHLLGKPVIYYDCPEFYEKYVTRYDGTLSLEECLGDDSINAGRNYGVVVRSLDVLKRELAAFAAGEAPPAGPAPQSQALLYNPGCSTGASLDEIDRIISSGCTMHRPHSSSFFPHLTSIARNVVRSWLHRRADHWLHRHGYRLARTGFGYLDAVSTVRSADEAGQSVCGYLESLETDPRKAGRRDRIVSKMQQCGTLEHIHRICEIGAGTGMYLEKVVEVADPEWYEVYETDPGWCTYLRNRYSTGRTRVQIRSADGTTLKDTETASCDLVHAHGVFVYLPLLQTLDYLREATRVIKPGGHLVFDCYLDRSFTLESARKWLDSQWRFPVVIPERLLLEYAEGLSLKLIEGFTEIHGATSVDYLVFRKC